MIDIHKYIQVVDITFKPKDNLSLQKLLFDKYDIIISINDIKAYYKELYNREYELINNTYGYKIENAVIGCS